MEAVYSKGGTKNSYQYF